MKLHVVTYPFGHPATDDEVVVGIYKSHEIADIVNRSVRGSVHSFNIDEKQPGFKQWAAKMGIAARLQQEPQ